MPTREFTSLEAALSLIGGLPPDEVARLLEMRVGRLRSSSRSGRRRRRARERASPGSSSSSPVPVAMLDAEFGSSSSSSTTSAPVSCRASPRAARSTTCGRAAYAWRRSSRTRSTSWGRRDEPWSSCRPSDRQPTHPPARQRRRWVSTKPYLESCPWTSHQPPWMHRQPTAAHRSTPARKESPCPVPRGPPQPGTQNTQRHNASRHRRDATSSRRMRRARQAAGPGPRRPVTDRRQGEVFGLLGPNGAGKSTTVKILSTLARADTGRATSPASTSHRDPNAVRRSIGLVSQKPARRPNGDRPENLVLAARIHGCRGRGAAPRRRAARAVRPHRRGRPARQDLQRRHAPQARRRHRARRTPEVLFLDEPTTGLDPEARSEMWAEIARLAGDDDLTVLLTTHYLEEADKLADRLAIVDHGQVVVEGTPDEPEERAPRRHRRRRGRSTSRRPMGTRLLAHRRPRATSSSRAHHAGAGRRRARRAVPSRPRHVGAGRRRGRVRHRRPPVAGRRLPPARRTLLRALEEVAS